MWYNTVMTYKPDKLMNARRRIWELDFLRGAAIMLMVFDHFMFDLAILPQFWSGRKFPPLSQLGPQSTGAEWWYYTGAAFFDSTFRLTFHYIFAGAFLLLTGISCTLSKDNRLRFVRLAGFAVILSLATIVLDGLLSLGVTILFGVIHLMALAVLFYIVIEGGVTLFSRILSKISGRKIALKSDLVLLLAGVALVIGGVAIEWYAIEWTEEIPDPITFGFMIRLIVGTVRAGGDHFGMMPCAGVVLIGAYIGRWLYADKRSLLPRLDGSWNRAFTFVGRHTVWVYMLHQVAVAGVILLVGLALGEVVL